MLPSSKIAVVGSSWLHVPQPPSVTSENIFFCYYARGGLTLHYLPLRFTLVKDHSESRQVGAVAVGRTPVKTRLPETLFGCWRPSMRSSGSHGVRRTRYKQFINERATIPVRVNTNVVERSSIGDTCRDDISGRFLDVPAREISRRRQEVAVTRYGRESRKQESLSSP